MDTKQTQAPTQESLSDTEKILAAYNGLPEDQKPVFMAAFTALISGMEIQERLAEKAI